MAVFLQYDLINPCASLVERGDRDRFLAIMAGTVETRQRLFPLYAFNLELARAAWGRSEAVIGEMRLSWWRDVVEQNWNVSHDIASPLQYLVKEHSLPKELLIDMINARQHDIHGEPFPHKTAFLRYIEHTSGALLELSVCVLGGDEAARAAARSYGFAAGIVHYLQAVPTLLAHGRQPLWDIDKAQLGYELSSLAIEANEKLAGVLPKIRSKDGICATKLYFAFWVEWQTLPLLNMALRRPEKILKGELYLSEFSRRLRLLGKVLTKRP